MASNGEIDQSAQHERALAERSQARYVLELFVTGLSALSIRAIGEVKDVCEERLPGRYELTIVDISRHPEKAREQQLIAVPTLIKHQPLPVRRLIGDLSNRQRVLAGLNL